MDVRSPRADVIVEIGEIVVDGLVVRDTRAFREVLQRTLERRLAEARDWSGIGDGSRAVVRADSLPATRAEGDSAAGEMVGERVAGAVLR